MVKLKKSLQKTYAAPGLSLICESLGVEQAAWQSGFYQRAPKKITAPGLFTSFWQMHGSGKNTLRNWAFNLGRGQGPAISEQSLNERLDERAVGMARAVLKRALNLRVDRQRLGQKKKGLAPLTGHFNRILIRDSTVQQLPGHLCTDFPGSHSKGTATAMVRIQALFDFTAEEWADFGLSAYTDNDQKAADRIAYLLRPNDLILQDLGYFTLDWLAQVVVGQYIITRWKPNVSLLGTDGGVLCLAAALKGKKEVDMPVLVGAKKKLAMRLVARRLPNGKAKRRIESARKDRHSRANHSDEYYELLKYEIYLTNIPGGMLTGRGVAKLYGLRWHIEILFKSWKSYANFKKMFAKGRMNLQRAKFTIYALLTEFVYIMKYIYKFVKRQLGGITDRQLSILRFMDVVNDLLGYILKIRSLDDLLPYIGLFARNATYGKHSKRKNTMEKYLYVKELCISFC